MLLTKYNWIFFCLLYSITCLKSSTTYGFDLDCNSGHGEKPILRLLSKEEDQMRIDENTYLFNNTGKEIAINCSAPYPIDLTFSGHLTNHLATSTITKKLLRNGQFCHQIIVKLNSFEEITGSYECFSVQEKNKSNSVYIYVSQRIPEYLINRRKDIIRIEASEESEYVIFPCASNNPKIKPYLEKESGDIPILLVNELEYDPKVGFKLYWRKRMDREAIFGKYFCKVYPNNENDTVLIEFVQPPDFIVEPNEDTVYLKKGQKFSGVCKSKDRVKITPLTNGHSLKTKSSFRELNNSNSPYKYVAQFQTYDEEKGGGSAIVSCVLDQQNGRENETNSTKSPELHVWNLIERINDTIKFTHYCKNKIVRIECSNWVECQMRKCLPYDAKCQSTCDQKFCSIPDGIFHCLDGKSEKSNTIIYFSDLDLQKKRVNVEKAKVNELLRINSESLKFDYTLKGIYCEGSQFLFAIGFRWFIKMENEPSIEIHEDYIKSTRSGLRKALIKSELSVDANFRNKMGVDMSKNFQLICSAPVWNTTEWRNASVEILAFGENKNKPEIEIVTTATDGKNPSKSDQNQSRVNLRSNALSNTHYLSQFYNLFAFGLGIYLTRFQYFI